jgi:hypothetical protein
MGALRVPPSGVQVQFGSFEQSLDRTLGNRRALSVSIGPRERVLSDGAGSPGNSSDPQARWRLAPDLKYAARLPIFDR